MDRGIAGARRDSPRKRSAGVYQGSRSGDCRISRRRTVSENRINGKLPPQEKHTEKAEVLNKNLFIICEKQ